ncbi:hypothetical protein [Nitratidesulfovibrio sp. 1201_IL3209]|uniref:hypothetical protein n=1 Tax=Nitratidesulfovibrio sp. 1201_IL3209 TaxID=3084053 RepID=UPI002FDA5F71
MTAIQCSLFDDKAARLAGLNATLKVSMRRALASCRLSRAQVVEHMNALASEAGVRLTTGNAVNCPLLRSTSG